MLRAPRSRRAYRRRKGTWRMTPAGCLFACGECNETFEQRVWHCRRCDAHIPWLTRRCSCHERER